MSIIEVKNLVKRYGELTAVDGISFSVTEGALFAFLGPNGAGQIDDHQRHVHGPGQERRGDPHQRI